MLLEVRNSVVFVSATHLGLCLALRSRWNVIDFVWLFGAWSGTETDDLHCGKGGAGRVLMDRVYCRASVIVLDLKRHGDQRNKNYLDLKGFVENVEFEVKLD